MTETNVTPIGVAAGATFGTLVAVARTTVRGVVVGRTVAGTGTVVASGATTSWAAGVGVDVEGGGVDVLSIAAVEVAAGVAEAKETVEGVG